MILNCYFLGGKGGGGVVTLGSEVLGSPVCWWTKNTSTHICPIFWSATAHKTWTKKIIISGLSTGWTSLHKLMQKLEGNWESMRFFFFVTCFTWTKSVFAKVCKHLKVMPMKQKLSWIFPQTFCYIIYYFENCDSKDRSPCLRTSCNISKMSLIDQLLPYLVTYMRVLSITILCPWVVDKRIFLAVRHFSVVNFF